MSAIEFSEAFLSNEFVNLHWVLVVKSKCFSTIHLFRKSFYCTCSGTFEKINMFILPTLMYYELFMIYSSFCKKPDKSSNAQTGIKSTITILLLSDVDVKENVFLLKSEKFNHDG